MRSAYATNPNAVKWDDSKTSAMRISSNAFSGAIFDKLDWMRKYKFRFRGITRVRDGEKIVFFFLDEPQILVGKKAKELLEADTSDGTAKFIPYKESDPRNIALQPTGVAYPEDWQNIVGVSYEIKKKRAGVLDAVSAADICNRGKKVINPFIGIIPPMSELEDEVERIYEAM